MQGEAVQGMTANNPSPGRTYRRLVSYVFPYRRRIILGIVFGLCFAGTNALLIAVIQGNLANVSGGGGDSWIARAVRDFLSATVGRMAGGEDAGLWQTVMLAALFPLLAVARGVFDYVANVNILWVGNRVVMDLRNEMFTHLHDLPVAYFSKSRTGELISRTASDTAVVERSVSMVLVDLAKQPVTLVVMVFWVVYLDPKLAFVSLVLFPLCLLPIIVFGGRVRRHTKEGQERIADVLAILQESIAGVRTVKAFGMEEHEKGRFTEQTMAFFKRTMRVVRASVAVEPIIVLLATFGLAAVLVYVHVQNMPLHRFFAFAVALFFMYEPVKRLSKVYVTIEQSRAAADRIFEVLDTPRTVADAPDAKELRPPIGEIRFESVSFGYEGEPVLRDIDLAIRPGERVALVGSSGAGKTTLVNLVSRFYDVTGGRLVINGMDVRSLTLASLRRQIGMVSQDTFLFNETVAANIAYGAGPVGMDAIVDAARKAHAHDFVSAMPQGYETILGERGVRLSGGQRQRLAIARAICRNPPVLILDEATNALDTESERLVQAALETVMEGRTVMAIAHRLSTIKRCDRIVVMDSGRIVETGNHEELMARGGIYRRLYDLQFGLEAGPTPEAK
jgi:subfamily B ATP-binding cassette protein MsbA